MHEELVAIRNQLLVAEREQASASQEALRLKEKIQSTKEEAAKRVQEVNKKHIILRAADGCPKCPLLCQICREHFFCSYSHGTLLFGGNVG